MSVTIGDQAPDFTLPTDGSGSVTLSALRGKPVVLYFYPKDDTSGCTAEACGFRDSFPNFGETGAVVIGVIAAGLLVFYFTLPGKGDVVRVSAQFELALRDHFLTTQKRTATDIVFYQCDGFYDARVGVETRTDLPNPLFQIGTYSSRMVPREGGWDITATPLSNPSEYVPCQ